MTKVVCPDLDLPPEAAVAALEATGDPKVDAWADDLADHYEKLEACD